MAIKPKYVLSFLKRNMPVHDYHYKFGVIGCMNCNLQIRINTPTKIKRDAMINRQYKVYAITDQAAQSPLFLLMIAPECKLNRKFIKAFNEVVPSCGSYQVSRVIMS